MKTLNQYINEKLVINRHTEKIQDHYNVFTDYKGNIDSLDNAIAFLWPKSKIEIDDKKEPFLVLFSCENFDDFIRICAVICDLWRDSNGNPASIEGDFNNPDDLGYLLGEERFSLVSKHVDLIEKELDYIHDTLSDPNNEEWKNEFYQ